MNIPYEMLIQGFHYEDLPRDKFIICVDQQQYVSNRAVQYLRQKGYHSKLLLGGIESLDGLMPLVTIEYD